jgi:hypothetical protein
MNVFLGLARYLLALGFLLFIVLLIGLVRQDRD